MLCLVLELLALLDFLEFLGYRDLGLSESSKNVCLRLVLGGVYIDIRTILVSRLQEDLIVHSAHIITQAPAEACHGQKPLVIAYQPFNKDPYMMLTYMYICTYTAYQPFH